MTDVNLTMTDVNLIRGLSMTDVNLIMKDINLFFVLNIKIMDCM